MSREIKFRLGITTGYDTFVYYNEEELKNLYTLIHFDGSVVSVDTKGELVKSRKEAYVVEQYTGLKDKNGKEIYEGDIVNIQGINYYVDFEFGGFWFNNDNRKWKANRPFTHFQEINDVEVIGNIHENKELLK